ncbi:coiled-coil domain-containing protein 12 isoform X3 [Neophocaena asiaeorientalis asiaeorientalis]|uniref:Coiled-coil domain-containing protein 12 isoform X3 n=1 Tax=Neophocaena asiaeorientalis asiaeorientalis TaxID=1706337 RepID=A0A341BYV9_NEOAA|nr:coiled-coil domain-containing protein 12 isoform X3 [Neophocaena asiaeorientalis asiaeorientalis]
MSAGKMAATAAGVGRLEEEALRRKERLKALREKTGRKKEDCFLVNGWHAASLDKEDGEPKTKQLREGEEEGEKHRELRLRNYVPEDEDLKKRRVPQAKPVAGNCLISQLGDPGTKKSTHASWLEVLAPSTLAGCRLLALLHPRIAFVLRNPSPSSRAAFAGSSPLVEEKVKEQLEAAKPEPIIEEVDLANLAPRKPDWDLKRDVAKKLEKLEKRTQRAIAELIRERLKGQEDNLASAVAATTTEQEAGDSD